MKMNLAKSLKGMRIGKWLVIESVQNKDSSGGNFSTGYIVEDDTGRTGFLKALDYSSAFDTRNTAETLNSMTSAFLFEKTLLQQCDNNGLRYVIKIIDGGSFELPEDYPDRDNYSLPYIDYMIFEKAEQSVRAIIDISKGFDSAWALRSLHNTAVGLQELHGIQVAHQDIKPSNILLFKEKKISKIGDVGRASAIYKEAAHDELNVAGDRNYSPFELLYGQIDNDWKTRRFSCDMFMFGNLVYTYFNNVSITAAVLQKLPYFSWPNYWKDGYDAVLPQIEIAFAECLDEFNSSVDQKLRSNLVAMVSELCSPNIKQRGDKRERGIQQYSLQRYISKLDYLAREYEYRMKMVLL